MTRSTLLTLSLVIPVLGGAGEFRKSWLYVDRSCTSEVLVEGQPWQVPVEYYLDPEDDDGGTSFTVWVGGPWIDCPDGKYTEKRFHASYLGMSREQKVKAGRGRHTVTFTVPPALPRNSMLIVCSFRTADGKAWPWNVRCGPVWFRRKGGFFELDTEKPGNLFHDGEPVQINATLRNVRDAGQTKSLRYTVRDVTREVVAEGTMDFRVERDGQQVAIPLELARRGTFLIEAEVPGWETRHTTFARIPDVIAITRDEPTRFGATNLTRPAPRERTEELCRIARRLGLTWCRTFVSWNELEPGPGEYRAEPFERAIEMAAEHGIRTWYCLTGPPAWALEGPPRNVSYQAFRCDLRAWRSLVNVVSSRSRGSLWGWEWLNEIVPGGTPASAQDYVALCRDGTRTAKAVDSELTTLLAGGLWPRSFRREVLTAGAGRYVDVLPVHYGNGSAVKGARADLEEADAAAAVWDNESAHGISTWGAPPLDDLARTDQSRWVLTQWVDELAAGCETIVYFGGQGDPAGNWSYLFDDHSPRPVVATLAVLAAKLHDAKPLGVFALGKGGLLYLFDRKGEAVLVASTRVASETIELMMDEPRGSHDQLVLTDYQGNERTLKTPQGIAAVPLSAMPVFIEGAHLDVVRGYTMAEIVSYASDPRRSALGSVPRFTVFPGKVAELLIRVDNPYSRSIEGTCTVELPREWGVSEARRLWAPKGAANTMPVSIAVPGDAALRDIVLEAEIDYGSEKIPRVRLPFVLAVVESRMLGNLFPDGGIEQGGWRVNGKTVRLAPAEGLRDGLGQRVLRFEKTGDQWVHSGQTLPLRGGLTYLYSAWVQNTNMHAGSNITQTLADGTQETLFDVHVFTCGDNTPNWQLFTARYRAPETLASASLVPVARGGGHAMFDNLRLTVYEGTDYAAEAHRCAEPPTMGIDVAPWRTPCPIPLIGRNQLTVTDPKYAWTPDNLSGIAWALWGTRDLFLAVRVRDDRHVPAASPPTSGDCLRIGLHPFNRAPGTDDRAVEYVVSSAPPGGGSGAYTLYRPEGRSAGLRHGHLFRDSSVYDLSIARSEGWTTYMLRIPFAELRGFRRAMGAKLGFSLELVDSDGRGPAARMNWGGGLSPGWRPASFGVLTLVE
jgi:hypothetical protein